MRADNVSAFNRDRLIGIFYFYKSESTYYNIPIQIAKHLTFNAASIYTVEGQNELKTTVSIENVQVHP